MIAITDPSVYSNLEYVESNSAILIPTQSEIQTLISSSEFINTNITTAFKNLLIQLSNESIYNGLPIQPASLISKISHMFNRVGFYRQNGILFFQANTGALDAGTDMIINGLNQYTNFQDIAYNAFHNNSWAKKANDIRAMTNSGLQKLHYITVFSNSNSNDSLNYLPDLNNSRNILNNRDEDAERFLIIELDNNGTPQMPNIRIYNNSDVQIKLRLKVEYYKYVTDSRDWMGGFGPGIPYDINNNGTIGPNERIYLNRHFLDYFPNQANAQDIENTIYTVIIQPQQFWDVNFDDRIRGGEAVIEFIPNPENVNLWEEGNHHYFKLHIRGKNPSYLQVRNYLNDQGYLNRFWFLIRKIRQETGSYGVNETDDNFEFKHFNSIENHTYSTRKTAFRGLPNFGPPRGFGIGQIDNFGTATTQQVPNPPDVGETVVLEINEGSDQNPDMVIRTIDFARKKVASDQEVWNWKRNIDASIRVLESKIEDLKRSRNPDNSYLSLADLHTQISNWNNNHPSNLVIGPSNQIEPPTNEIPTSQGDRITFRFIETEIEGLEDYNSIFNGATASNENEKSFFDACLLKAYNGYGSGTQRNYIYSYQTNQTTKPVTNILRHALVGGRDYYYVREVCRRND